MVLERKERGKIAGTDVILDFENKEVVERIINNILGHEIFATDPETGQENIREEIVMKTIKCQFTTDSVVLVTGTDPQTQETYAVVVEVVDKETLGRRKIILVGSSEQLRQLHAAGKMSEYAGLSEKLRRKKGVLYLKLFDGV